MPAETEPSTTVHATGPIGVQPKKWLTPGVSMTATSTAADATLVPITSGLCQPVSSVCASWVPTSAASPIVLARRLRPVYRPIVHASSAPSVVAPPRTAIARASVESNRVGTPVAASSSRLGATATARAGNMSVNMLTSSICRTPIGARPPSAVPRTMNATSPALPPTRIDTASRTCRHSVRPSSSAS